MEHRPLYIQRDGLQGKVQEVRPGLDHLDSRTVFNYNDPETLIRLLTQAENKSFTFVNGLPSVAQVAIIPAEGVQFNYRVNYTFTDGLPSEITYTQIMDDATEAVRAVKRLTFTNGLPATITIGVS